MKKIIAAMLSIVGVSCMGAALAACDGEPVYYKLVYENDAAVVVDFRGIMSGAEVKEGYTVEFTCTLAENAEGDPAVMVNGKEIYPDINGVYSFVMDGEKNVTFENAIVLKEYEVNFDKGDYRVDYSLVNGDKTEQTEKVSAKMGEKVTFSIGVSVYYGDKDFTVLANTTILSPDDDGNYSFTVTGNTNVSIVGLELDDTFLDRPDGGKGTASDPYLVERPIDLYLMADRINDDWYNGRYGSAYYKLNADIDMKGEQLYVIGDSTGNYAFFSGEFDGNGKTISNFYISGDLIEQSSYTEVALPFVGLFGYAVASYERAPRIYDLTLDNFTVEVNAAKHSAQCFVGGLVGYGIGAEIYDCTVNGEIIIDADKTNFSYVGGLIGFQQSAYVSEDLKYYSGINACSANVDIRGESGNVFSAGGIAGYVYTAEEKTAAYVINSYSSGEIVGAMNAGGIVGYLSPYSSVKNCYSVCEYIEADCINAYTSINARLSYAYAGGIVGYADSDTAVTNCFATVETAAHAQAGNGFAFSGDIVGYAGEASNEVVGSTASLIIACYGEKDVVTNKSFYTDTLGWSETDWSFDGEYPVAKTADGSRNVTVTVNYGNVKVNGENVVRISLDAYLPVSVWYNQAMEQFVESGELRSYGYFFTNSIGSYSDAVPYSYVFTGGETLHVGFANYNEIAGKYYLNLETDGSGAYIELGADGSLKYMNGARNFDSYYTYDGSSAILYNCPALTEIIDEETNTISYATGRATLSGNTLTIVNLATYTENSPLKAVKEISGFRYGRYYDSNNVDYVFNSDGTGRIGAGEVTYTVSGATLSVDNNGQTLIGAVSGGEVVSLGGVTLTPYDEFSGVWEKSATSHKQFSFDGKGGWNYNYFGYTATGTVKNIEENEGVYVYDSANDKIILKDNLGNVLGEASYNEDGFLNVIYNGAELTYYKKSSYVGSWRYFYKKEAISITLNGVGSDGFGKAYVGYESIDEVVEMTYEIVSAGGTDFIYIYNGDVNYGVLSYNVLNSTLTGSIYSFAVNGVLTNALFCLTDDFKGSWLSTELNTVEFNGLGLYDLKASDESQSIKTSGTVKIGGKSVAYKLDYSTMSGSFVYKDVTYEIEYDDALNVIKVKAGESEYLMHRRDAYYGVELCDENGAVYTFNGGGKLENGGTLLVDGQSYGYKIEEDGTITVFDGNVKYGEIYVENNVYKFEKTSGTTELTVHSDFVGGWVICGEPGKTLVVGKIGADGTAAGSYLGQNVTFDYDGSYKSLSFEWQGETLYIRSLSAADSVELAISKNNNTFGEFDVCIRAERLDAYVGTYTAADGSRVVFDGFGNSVFGKGSATLYAADNKVISVYTYTINMFGMPELSGDGKFVFKEVDFATIGAYKSGDKAYKIVKTDILYCVSAVDKDEKVYTFDGAGTVVCSDGKVYSYSDVEINTLEFTVTFNVTDSEGEQYFGKINYSTSEYLLTLTEKGAQTE